MRTPRPLPAELPDAMRVGDTVAAGVGYRRLRHPRLHRPFHGVRVDRDDSDAPDQNAVALKDARVARERALRRIREYLPVMPAHAFLTGISAALLHGIPVPARLLRKADGSPADVVVGVHEPRTPPRRPGVRGVRRPVRLTPVTEVDGIRVTTRAATWASLGPVLDEYDLVAAADFLIRIPRHPGGFRPPEREPYATREELAAAIGNRRGGRRLREALDRARTGASSPPETRLRLLLVDGGLPEPQLDYDVLDAQGRFIACLDGAYPEWRIGLEYDGSGHREQKQFERDMDKLAELDAEGWTILRFASRHIHRQPGVVLARVRAAIARASNPGS